IKIIVIGKLCEDDGGDWSLGLVEGADGLGHAILEHTEVLLVQPGNKYSILAEYAHVERHHRHFDGNGKIWHALDRFGLGPLILLWRLGIGLPGHRNGAYIALGPSGFTSGIWVLLVLLILLVTCRLLRLALLLILRQANDRETQNRDCCC